MVYDDCKGGSNVSLTRSQLAKESNVNAETIRYYINRGLIADPPRSDSGYRLFPIETVQRIIFIKRSQELGFTLEEILQLLRVSDDKESHDAIEIQQMTEKKIKEIDAKLNDLNKMKSALEELAKQCPGAGHSIHECPIIHSLAGE